MGTPNPRPRGGATMRDLERANANDRGQMRRLLSTPPRPKVAPPVSGGIVGQAELVSSGGVVFNAGTSEMSYGGVTYDAPTDANAGGDGESSVPVSSWLSVDGYQIFVDPGWYIPVLYMRVQWDDLTQAPPAFGGPYTSGGYDAVHNLYGIHARIPFTTDGKGGFQQIANYGPAYIHEGSDLHAELRALGGNATAPNNSSPLLSRIAWDITKLS
jgi:hypothetical protein